MKRKLYKERLAALLLLVISSLWCPGRLRSQDIIPLLDSCNINWNVPGPGSAESMPIGNGDIGLNVWVEQNGDLVFYIGKTDTWGPDVRGAKGLMKTGCVRVSLDPAPLTVGAPFLQTLRLHEGEILIREGNDKDVTQIRVWVDANNPVIRVETKSDHPVAAKVTLSDWRLGKGGDTLLNKGSNTITWYHRNGTNADPQVAGLTFGATIRGNGLVRKDDTTLVSGRSGTGLLSIYPLTMAQTTVSQWQARLEKQVARIEKLPLQQTRLAHQQWWDKFWHRSWIYIRGDSAARTVTEGYVLQRFVTACAGRGAYPIKFNGSIFVVDNPAYKSGGSRDKPPVSVDADYRTWGGQYWFQNTRPMYWPRLMAGDFDEMEPLFNMYAAILPANAVQVMDYYHHGGAYFAETAPFWGGLRYWGPEVKEDWTGHYFTPILELSMMMLDYYEYTGDRKFAKELLLPVASAGLQFFDQHFTRDSAGKLLLDPDNSIEMFWKVHNPAPDIAGLHAITTRMLALPFDLTSAADRAGWQRLQQELPDLPVGTKDGKDVLLPYTGEQTAKPRNLENPELYAIYPFRLYGLDKPDLPLAINTFNARRFKDKGCWVQDPIQAAMLGLSDVAKTYVTYNFNRKDPALKFPAFWAEGHDYMPDEDNGGNGENGLQEMLMQVDGKKILLLPAWPKEWDAGFKLHAPYNTTVEGKVVGGKLTDLIVTPVSRKVDVIDMSNLPPAGKSQPGSKHSRHSLFESYKGLVMAGYQGWFNAPDDGAGRGWNHYHSRGAFEPGNCKFDIWPDVSGYKKTYPTPFKHTDSSTAYLFSSYDASTTDLHFKWMQEYGIDGVFMQRFVASIRNDPSLHHTNTVLAHAMAASRKYRRAIAVMYDLSGMNDNTDVDLVIKDWKNLVDSMKVTGGGDRQTYLYHRGKPLVTIWGTGFNDHRAYTPASVKKIMDFLQYDPVYGGCSIMLGAPTYWRDQGSDASKDPAWTELFKRADIIQPWLVGRFSEKTYPPFIERIREDIAWCKANGADYVPVVFPGFSWHNMNPNAPQDQIPRDSGRFFWEQVRGDLQAGSEMLYFAMFDEIDEGTAIFKASLDPPVGKSHFVTFDPGIPSDYYLNLAGYAGKVLRKEVPLPEEVPAPDTFKKKK